MFCLLPFTELLLTSEGTARICCEAWMPTSIGNVLTTPIKDIWNGPIAQKIRLSIIDQSFSYCTKCPFLFSKLSSPTKHVNKPFQIKQLRLAYDPTCNLTCPSCRNTPLGPSNFPVPNTSQITHDALLESGILKDITYLGMAGYGDPFASSLYWQLLLDIPRINPKVAIHLHTNGLLLSPEKWNELGKTTQQITGITISVDASCGTTYRINRKSSWSQLLNNIKFAASLVKKLQLNFVIQNNNFREMPDFVTMAWKYGASNVFFEPIGNWTNLSQTEYELQAVHLPSHPRHTEFLKILNSPIMQDPRITLAWQHG